jgi:hypothetical protein
MEEKKTCKDLIETEYEDRKNDLKETWSAYCAEYENDEEMEEAQAELYNYGLSFQYDDDGYFVWLFSWGGPSDLVKFYCGPNFTLHSVEYRYHDWFDGAGKTIDHYHKDFPFWKELWELLFENRDD